MLNKGIVKEKKQMKKFLATLMVMVLTVCMVGCSSGPSKDELEKALTKELGRICDTDSLSHEDTLSQRITKISTAVSENKLSSNKVLDSIGSGTSNIKVKADFDIGFFGAAIVGTLDVNGKIQYGDNVARMTVGMGITSDDTSSFSELEAYLDWANNVVYSRSSDADHWEKQDLNSANIKEAATSKIPVNTESLPGIDKEAVDKFGAFCDKHTEVTDEGDDKHALKTEFSWKDFYEEYKDQITKAVADSAGSMGSYIDVDKMLGSNSAAFTNKITFTPDNEVCAYEFKMAEFGVGDKQEGSIWITIKNFSLNIDIDDTDITVEIPAYVVEGAEQKQNAIDYMYEEINKGMSEAQADVEESKANLDKYYNEDDNSEEDNDAGKSTYVAPPTAPETTDGSRVKIEDNTDYELGTEENDDHTFGEFEEPDDYVRVTANSVVMDVDTNGTNTYFEIPNRGLDDSQAQDGRYTITVYESDSEYFTGADYTMEWSSIDSIEAAESAMNWVKDSYGSASKLKATAIEGSSGAEDYVVTYETGSARYVVIYTHVDGCKNCIRTSAFTYERDGKYKYEFEELLEKFKPVIY